MSSTASPRLIPCRFAVANFLTGKQFCLKVLVTKTNHIVDFYSTCDMNAVTLRILKVKLNA